MENDPWIRPGVARLSAEFDAGDLEFWKECPARQGLCRHAWLVSGERKVLIDPFESPEIGWDPLVEELENLGLKPSEIGLVVLTSGTPDSPAVIEKLIEANPEIQIAVSQTELVRAARSFPQKNLKAIGSGDQIDLGLGKALRFFEIAEQPGELRVLEEASGVLFSGDLYSGLGASGVSIYADELSASELDFFKDEALRWYASRFPFAELENSDPLYSAAVVAPRLGLIWRNPAEVLSWYRHFAQWAAGPAEGEATVVGTPALGLGEPWFGRFVEGLRSGGADVHLLDLGYDDLATVVAKIVRATGLAVLSSENGAALLDRLERLGVDKRIILVLDHEPWPRLANLGTVEVARGVSGDPDLAYKTGLSFGERIRNS